jgi:hypothetical protein
MSVRSSVKCSQCGADLVRVTWNYGKNRPSNKNEKKEYMAEVAA